jgi:hypothetical protein
MTNSRCLILGHKWKKRRVEDGVYLRRGWSGAESITSGEYGMGGAEANRLPW